MATNTGHMLSITATSPTGRINKAYVELNRMHYNLTICTEFADTLKSIQTQLLYINCIAIVKYRLSLRS